MLLYRCTALLLHYVVVLVLYEGAAAAGDGSIIATQLYINLQAMAVTARKVKTCRLWHTGQENVHLLL